MATLLPDVGVPIQLETPLFLHLVEAHTITVPDDSQAHLQIALSQEVHRLLTEAGPEALDVANMRFRVVHAYQSCMLFGNQRDLRMSLFLDRVGSVNRR